MSEGGRLDLSSSGLGPHELVELAPQLTQLIELILDFNDIFGELYIDGDVTEPEPEPDGALVHTVSGPAFPNKGITLEGLEAFLAFV